ncbi:MAG: DUF357 domain-containing protein [Candidatus Woesearchaeota archaeon]
MNNEITQEKMNKYFDITGRALKKVAIVSDSFSVGKTQADDFFDMASRYYADAQHFYKQGDWVLAYGALNYAHGWLDAGARLGLFDVDGDDVLFTVDAKK